MTKIALGFDYGEKRIGIAVGQTLTQTASAIKTITTTNKQIDWSSITILVEEWDPEIFILGRPSLKSGREHHLTREIEKFSRRLIGRYQRPVEFIDERLSSRAAVNYEEEVDNAGLDAVAAKLILETWLQERPVK
jgi:putative Holliday junction resolvase